MVSLASLGIHASIRMSVDGVPIQGLPETLVSSMFTNFCPLVVTKEAMARAMEAYERESARGQRLCARCSI